MCGDDGVKALTVLCVITSFIVILIVILSGIRSLDSNEIAIDYNRNIHSLDTSALLENGVHYVGVGHELVRYTKAVIDMDMQNDLIYARTYDGLVVTLGTRIIYRLTLDPQALGFLYLAFGKDYQDPYYYLSRQVINDVASRYTAFQFWSERETISSAMRDALTTNLEDLYAVLDDFSLSNYDLPLRFQDAIVETDVQAQEYEQVAYQQDTARTQRDTAILAADQEVLAISNTAEADAEAYLLSVDATVQNLEWATQSEKSAYADVKTILGLDNEELTRFVWLDTVNYWARDSKQRYSLATPDILTY